jgi:hypothetical protein
MATSATLARPHVPYRNIVILGNFNPVIIQPSFLRTYKILPEQEIATSEDIDHREESRDKIAITARRFLISANKTILVFRSAIFEMSRERLQVTLRPTADHKTYLEGLKKLFRVLAHTPINAVGFNFQAHWRITGGDDKVRSLFTGDMKLFKATFGKEMFVGGKVRFEDLQAKVLLETEKSFQYTNAVYLNFNFHYDIEDQKAESLIKILSNFERAMERAKTIGITIYGKPLEVILPPETIEVSL